MLRDLLVTCQATYSTVASLLAPELYDLDTLLVPEPGVALACAPDAVILFSPRLWARLDRRARHDPRAVLLRYLLSPRDVQDLALEIAAPNDGGERRAG